MKAELGHNLVELKREIYSQVGYSAAELITISRPSVYGEYTPYKVVETEEEFKEAAYKLVEKELK